MAPDEIVTRESAGSIPNRPTRSMLECPPRDCGCRSSSICASCGCALSARRIAITVGFIVAYFFSDQLFAALTLPIRQVAHDKLLLIGTGVGEAFFTKIKVSLVAGLFLASPAVFYEIWKFIAPGLYQTERKMAFPFIIFATIFFVSGGYFCWAVVFKVGYAFFLEQYSSIGVTPTIRISEYLAFSAKLMLAFAITFEMPIFAFFLTRLGLIDYKMMLKQFRYAILIIFVIAAALDAARHGLAIPARDPAAVPLRHQRRRVVRIPQQDRTATAAENPAP